MSAEQQQVSNQHTPTLNKLLRDPHAKKYVQQLLNAKDASPEFYAFFLEYIDKNPVPQQSNQPLYWDHLIKRFSERCIEQYYQEYLSRISPDEEIETLLNQRDPQLMSLFGTIFIETMKPLIHAPLFSDISPFELDSFLLFIDRNQIASQDEAMKQKYLESLCQRFLYENQKPQAIAEFIDSIEQDERFSFAGADGSLGKYSHLALNVSLNECLKQQETTAEKYLDTLTKKIALYDKCAADYPSYEAPLGEAHSCVFDDLDPLEKNNAVINNFNQKALEVFNNTSQANQVFNQILDISLTLHIPIVNDDLIDKICKHVDKDLLLEVLSQSKSTPARNRKLFDAIITQHFHELKKQYSAQHEASGKNDLYFVTQLKSEYGFEKLGDIENLDFSDVILSPENFIDTIKCLSTRQQHSLIKYNLDRDRDFLIRGAAKRSGSYLSLYLDALLQMPYQDSIGVEFSELYERRSDYGRAVYTTGLRMNQEPIIVKILTGKLIQIIYDRLPNSHRSFYEQPGIANDVSDLSFDQKEQLATSVHEYMSRQKPIVNTNTASMAASSSASSSQTIDSNLTSTEEWLAGIDAVSRWTNIYDLNESAFSTLDSQRTQDIWHYLIKKPSGAFSSIASKIIVHLITSNNDEYSKTIKNFMANSKDQINEIYNALKKINNWKLLSGVIGMLNEEQLDWLADNSNRDNSLDLYKWAPDDFVCKRIMEMLSQDLNEDQFKNLFQMVISRLSELVDTMDLVIIKRFVAESQKHNISLDSRMRVARIIQKMVKDDAVYDDAFSPSKFSPEALAKAYELMTLAPLEDIKYERVARLIDNHLSGYVRDNEQALFSDISIPDNQENIFNHLQYILNTARNVNKARKDKWSPGPFECFNSALYPLLSRFKTRTIEHLAMMAKIDPTIINVSGYVDLLRSQATNALQEKNFSVLEIILNIIGTTADANVDTHKAPVLKIFHACLDDFIQGNHNGFESNLALLQKIEKIIAPEKLNEILCTVMVEKFHHSMSNADDSDENMIKIHEALTYGAALLTNEADKRIYVTRILTNLSTAHHDRLLDLVIEEFIGDSQAGSSTSSEMNTYPLTIQFLINQYPKTVINKLNGLSENKNLINFLRWASHKTDISALISSDALNLTLLETLLELFITDNDQEKIEKILSHFPRNLEIFEKLLKRHETLLSYPGAITFLCDVVMHQDELHHLLSLIKTPLSDHLSNNPMTEAYRFALNNFTTLAIAKYLSSNIHDNSSLLNMMHLAELSHAKFSDASVENAFIDYWLDGFDKLESSFAEIQNNSDFYFNILDNHTLFIHSDSFAKRFIERFATHPLIHEIIHHLLEYKNNQKILVCSRPFLTVLIHTPVFLSYLDNQSPEEKSDLLLKISGYLGGSVVWQALGHHKESESFLIDLLANEQRSDEQHLSQIQFALSFYEQLLTRYPRLIFSQTLLTRLLETLNESHTDPQQVECALRIFSRLSQNGQQGHSYNALANGLLTRLLMEPNFPYPQIKHLLSEASHVEFSAACKDLLSNKLEAYFGRDDCLLTLEDISLFYVKHSIQFSDLSFQRLKAKFGSPSDNDLDFYFSLIKHRGFDAFKINHWTSVPLFTYAVRSENPAQNADVAALIKDGFPKLSHEEQSFFIHFLNRIDTKNQMNMIHQIVIQGNATLLTALLQLDLNITKGDYIGCDLLGRLKAEDRYLTPLALAIALNNKAENHQPYLEIAQSLITHQKGNINFVMPDGLTALHLAAQAGDLDMVTLLLSHEAVIPHKAATLNFRARLSFAAHNLLEYTALDYAIENGHLDVVKYLIDSGCDYLSQRRHLNTDQNVIYSYPIERAAKHPKIFAYLLTLEGIDKDKKFPTNAQDNENLLATERRMTLLKHCIDHNNLDGITRLLRMGVNIHETVHIKTTASQVNDALLEEFYGTHLHYAIHQGNVPAVELLLSYYPELNGFVQKNSENYKKTLDFINELREQETDPEKQIALTSILDKVTQARKPNQAFAPIYKLKSLIETCCEQLEKEKSLFKFTEDELNTLCLFATDAKYKNAYERIEESELYLIHKNLIEAHLSFIQDELALRNNPLEKFFTAENCQLLAGLIAKEDERAMNFFKTLLLLSGRWANEEETSQAKPLIALSEQCAHKLKKIRINSAMQSVKLDQFSPEEIEEFFISLAEQQMKIISMTDEHPLEISGLIQTELNALTPNIEHLKQLTEKLLECTRSRSTYIDWQALKNKFTNLQSTWPMRCRANDYAKSNEDLTALISKMDGRTCKDTVKANQATFFRAPVEAKNESQPAQPSQVVVECHEDESALAACSYLN